MTSRRIALFFLKL